MPLFFFFRVLDIRLFVINMRLHQAYNNLYGREVEQADSIMFRRPSVWMMNVYCIYKLRRATRVMLFILSVKHFSQQFRCIFRSTVQTVSF